HPSTRFDIWTVPLSISAGLQAGTPEIFAHTRFDERHPCISPDGRWLAYASSESGTQQIYVQEFPGSPLGAGRRWLISSGAGAYPIWSSDKRQLFFRADDDRIMVAEYAITKDSFVAGK